MFTVRRRGRAARFGTAIMAIGALAAVALPAASAATSRPASPSSASPTAPASNKKVVTHCVTTGVKTTCTGTASGDNAYNPWAAQTDFVNPNVGFWPQISHPPVVTVSQTKNLTDQIVNVNWQYFTPSLDVGGSPNGGANSQNYEVLVEECKGTNPKWGSNGLSGCYGSTEGVTGQGALGNALVPPNSSAGVTYASGAAGEPASWGGPSTATGGNPANWKGSAQFHIETGVTNSILGCDVHTPCSLVIVPNFGGNYSNVGGVRGVGPDTTGDCENHFYDSLVTGNLSSNNAFATDGACSYMDRIVVPLSFAPTPSNCPANAINNPEFHAEGSPMMARQMTQWQTAWCTGPAGSLNFASVSEDSARTTFLQGNRLFGAGVDMALTTQPPTASEVSSSSRKFTYAPLANSGTAIAYYLDDGQPAGTLLTGQPIKQMVLDPRLVAKLTTESYALNYDCTAPASRIPAPWPPPPAPSPWCDPAVSHNTGYLFTDPEFLSLNKNCQPATAPKNYVCTASDFPGAVGLSNNMQFGPFLPTMLGAFSDMTYQLTGWVGANADARVFLAGKPDPQGMHVNTYYKNTSYPAQQLFPQDPGVRYPGLKCVAVRQGCIPNTSGPAASMQAAWTFVTSLGGIAQNLLAFQPNAENLTLQCTDPSGTCTNLGQWQNTHVSPQTPGSRALLSEMDLGDAGVYQFPAAALVNAAGKAVAPSQASVEATVAKDMTTNPDGITQQVNLSGKDPAAYPLAMVDYAMVPTCGLPHAEATAIADFLDNVATAGQKPGVLPGQLQQGYYPLTSAQRAQTLKAAQEVKAQDCSGPPKGHKGGHKGTTPPPNSTPTGPASTPTAPGGTTPTAPGGTTPTAPGGTTPTANPRTTGNGPGTGSTPPGRNPGAYNNAAYGQKSSDSGLSGILLPGILLMLLGALLVGSAVWALAATGRWPMVRRRVQGLFRGRLVRRAQAR